MTIAAASPGLPVPARDRLARVLVAGLAGGAVDFVYPIVMALSKGRAWDMPWRSVASGWIGKAARDAAWAPALGILTHFCIATAMAATYALAARRFPVLYRLWWAAAPVYGLILYGIMYRVVLPLRWAGAGAWDGMPSVLDVGAHVGVAYAIAFVLSRSAPIGAPVGAGAAR
ncbi:MAG: hypothetical protein JNL41_12680 [Phenylobacterium sp.]|uniref:hypothetical protein n=1 Tax=Phenylobacterium sp. TaxID=1871053 RepID=UPI001A5157A0|nr:hypothetical protein [Phenylobacterium sp.]MBL8555130.1 hypothetical protein [Phenylobacterium sp.]